MSLKLLIEKIAKKLQPEPKPETVWPCTRQLHDGRCSRLIFINDNSGNNQCTQPNEFLKGYGCPHNESLD